MNQRDDSANAGYELESNESSAKPYRPLEDVPKAQPPDVQHPQSAPPRRADRKQWNELIGLRNAVFAIAWRAVIALAVWTALVWLLTPGMAWIQANGARWGPSFLLVGPILFGLPVGWIVSRGVTEAAGFVSLIVTAMVCIVVIACILGGSVIGSLLRGTVVFTGVINGVAIVSGCGLAFVKTWLEE